MHRKKKNEEILLKRDGYYIRKEIFAKKYIQLFLLHTFESPNEESYSDEEEDTREYIGGSIPIYIEIPRNKWSGNISKTQHGSIRSKRLSDFFSGVVRMK